MKVEGAQVSVPEAFVRYVRRMRRLQKEFFHGHREVIGEAKSAEKAVDFYLANIEEGREEEPDSLFSES